jgi:hypothetical protein
VQIKPEDRKTEEIKRLQVATMQVKWFADLDKHKINRERDVHWNLCSKLKFERSKSYATLFRMGDNPTKFYIILQGVIVITGPRGDAATKRDRYPFQNKENTELP